MESSTCLCLCLPNTLKSAHYSSCSPTYFPNSFQCTCTQIPKGITFLGKDISLDCVLALSK